MQLVKILNEKFIPKGLIVFHNRHYKNKIISIKIKIILIKSLWLNCPFYIVCAWFWKRKQNILSLVKVYSYHSFNTSKMKTWFSQHTFEFNNLTIYWKTNNHSNFWFIVQHSQCIILQTITNNYCLLIFSMCILKIYFWHKKQTIQI